jgi:hypothetical protein
MYSTLARNHNTTENIKSSESDGLDLNLIIADEEL